VSDFALLLYPTYITLIVSTYSNSMFNYYPALLSTETTYPQNHRNTQFTELF